MPNETARRNHDQGWAVQVPKPCVAEGSIARKLKNQAFNLKAVAQRVADRDTCEALIDIANNIIDESGRVNALETLVPVGE